MNADSQALLKMVLPNAKRAKDYYVGTLISCLNFNLPIATNHLREIMSTMKAALFLTLPSVF